MLDLYIRSADINGTIVADKNTNLAVAEFFNQAGADGVPYYSAQQNAVMFMAIVEMANAVACANPQLGS